MRTAAGSKELHEPLLDDPEAPRLGGQDNPEFEDNENEGSDDGNGHHHIEDDAPWQRAAAALNTGASGPAPWMRHMAVTGLGTLLVLAAVALHYSGWEAIDYKDLDDRCYKASHLKLNGLPVDACLNRTHADVGIYCGAPAADAMCKQLGDNYLVNYTLSPLEAQDTLGAITLGNQFIGGRLQINMLCCDAGIYEPPVSRWLLYIGGIMLLYSFATLATMLALWAAEILVVSVCDAGELLYFFLGLNRPIRYLLWSLWLGTWTHAALYSLWCAPGIDCEDHGSDTRKNFGRLARCLVIFAVAHLVARTAPRVIAARCFLRREMGAIRDMMQKEALLSALAQPEVKEQLHHIGVTRERQTSQQRQQQLASATRHSANANSAHDGMSRIAELRLGQSGAMAAFQSFLAKYQKADRKQLQRDAIREGDALYDNLVSLDVNHDGAVGLNDFVQLFRELRITGFSGSQEAAARMAWSIFDLNKDNTLSRQEVKQALERIYAQRINIALTVESTDSAVNSLQSVIGFVLYTCMAFAALSIFEISTTFGGTSLDFFTTYVLALSFIFGDTMRGVFRSTLYLFGQQPFQVGDLLLIEGSLWRVASFDLIYTVLYQWGANSCCHMPNEQLMDSQLINVSRGKAMKDSITLKVPLALPLSVVDSCRTKLAAEALQRPKDFVSGSIAVHCDNVETDEEGGLLMTVTAEWVYNFSPAERIRVDNARTAMIAVLRQVLVDSGYVGLPEDVMERLATKSKSE